MSSPTLKEKVFDVLNRHTNLKMTEKVSLLNQVLTVDVNPFSAIKSGRDLMTIHTSACKGLPAALREGGVLIVVSFGILLDTGEAKVMMISELENVL